MCAIHLVALAVTFAFTPPVPCAPSRPSWFPPSRPVAQSPPLPHTHSTGFRFVHGWERRRRKQPAWLVHDEQRLGHMRMHCRQKWWCVWVWVCVCACGCVCACVCVCVWPGVSRASLLCAAACAPCGWGVCFRLGVDRAAGASWRPNFRSSHDAKFHFLAPHFVSAASFESLCLPFLPRLMERDDSEPEVEAEAEAEEVSEAGPHASAPGGLRRGATDAGSEAARPTQAAAAGTEAARQTQAAEAGGPAPRPQASPSEESESPATHSASHAVQQESASPTWRELAQEWRSEAWRYQQLYQRQVSLTLAAQLLAQSMAPMAPPPPTASGSGSQTRPAATSSRSQDRSRSRSPRGTTARARWDYDI